MCVCQLTRITWTIFHFYGDSKFIFAHFYGNIYMFSSWISADMFSMLSFYSHILYTYIQVRAGLTLTKCIRLRMWNKSRHSSENYVTVEKKDENLIETRQQQKNVERLQQKTECNNHGNEFNHIACQLIKQKTSIDIKSCKC